MSNLLEKLNTSVAVGQDYHDAVRRDGGYQFQGGNRLNMANEALQRRIESEEDTYPVEPDLSKQDLRTLYKIVNKQFYDCGRKRGAILRYIKAYTPEPKPNLGARIVQHLKNL